MKEREKGKMKERQTMGEREREETDKKEEEQREKESKVERERLFLFSFPTMSLPSYRNKMRTRSGIFHKQLSQRSEERRVGKEC